MTTVFLALVFIVFVDWCLNDFDASCIKAVVPAAATGSLQRAPAPKVVNQLPDQILKSLRLKMLEG